MMTTPTELEVMRLMMEHFKRETEALRSGACTCGLSKHFLPEDTHVADCASLVHKRIRAESISQHEAEHRALVADNAALLKAGDMLAVGPRYSEPSEEEAIAIAVLAQTHPGAALLSELHDLRARVEMMGRASWYADFQQEQAKRLAAERERDEALAQAATARDAAMEEIALRVGEADIEWSGDGVRALKSQPASRFVDAEEVRKVLRNASATLARQGYGSGIIRDIARGLDINLDGEP